MLRCALSATTLLAGHSCNYGGFTMCVTVAVMLLGGSSTWCTWFRRNTSRCAGHWLLLLLLLLC